MALSISGAPTLNVPVDPGATVPHGMAHDFAALFATVAGTPSGATVPVVFESTVTPEMVGGVSVAAADPEVSVTSSVTPSTVPASLTAAKVSGRNMAIDPTTNSRVDEIPLAALTGVEREQVGTDNVHAIDDVTIDEGTTVPAVTPPVTPQPAVLEDVQVAAPLLQALHTAPDHRLAVPAANQDTTVIAVIGSVPDEVVTRVKSEIAEPTEVWLVPAVEMRRAGALPGSDRPVMQMPERVVTFAPIIADAMRDLVSLAQDKDVRFNVRPEILGPVAVTIERTDAGPTLKLGVETQAAVHAVRQAESMMNDPRGTAPFVQVSVDMNAPDSRGRPAQAVPPRATDQNHVSEQMQRQLPAPTGRYA